jgi:hypothetical protein
MGKGGCGPLLPLPLLLALLPLLFFPTFLPNTYALSPLIVDVWTNKGGQGQNNLDGGQYTVGEPITITCEFYGGAKADRMDLLIVRPDGSWSLYPLGTNIDGGTYSTTVSGPVGEWMVACAVKFGGSTLGDLVNFTVLPPPQTLTVDVWTDKGGQGIGNLNGGQYSIGESITLDCSVNMDVEDLSIRAIRPDGAEVLLLHGPASAGTHSVSGTVGEPTGEWRVICEAYSHPQISRDEVRFTVLPRPQTLTVDVWTNKGGQGVGNPDGGQYTVGESITLYCETTAGATLLRMVLIRPDGSSVEVLKLSNVQAGTYSVSGTVGEPTGVWIASCIAQHGERDPVVLLWDDVRFTVQERATVTVTVYTTTTRTVTSTLHATATTETTTYTTTTRTLYTTFTRTWYTTVTTTVTTTITSWTTTTVRTTVTRSASYEGGGEGLVVLSLAALTPLASAHILRTRRRSRNPGGVMRG